MTYMVFKPNGDVKVSENYVWKRLSTGDYVYSTTSNKWYLVKDVKEHNAKMVSPKEVPNELKVKVLLYQ